MVLFPGGSCDFMSKVCVKDATCHAIGVFGLKRERTAQDLVITFFSFASEECNFVSSLNEQVVTDEPQVVHCRFGYFSDGGS